MVDHNKISTAFISIVGLVLAYVISNPATLQALMGDYYLQFGAAILAILTVIYNLVYQNGQPVIEP